MQSSWYGWIIPMKENIISPKSLHKKVNWLQIHHPAHFHPASRAKTKPNLSKTQARILNCWQNTWLATTPVLGWQLLFCSCFCHVGPVSVLDESTETDEYLWWFGAFKEPEPLSGLCHSSLTSQLNTQRSLMLPLDAFLASPTSICLIKKAYKAINVMESFQERPTQEHMNPGKQNTSKCKKLVFNVPPLTAAVTRPAVRCVSVCCCLSKRWDVIVQSKPAITHSYISPPWHAVTCCYSTRKDYFYILLYIWVHEVSALTAAWV